MCHYHEDTPIACAFAFTNLIEDWQDLASARCKYYESACMWTINYSLTGVPEKHKDKIVGGPYNTKDEAIAAASQMHNVYLCPYRQDSSIRMLATQALFNINSNERSIVIQTVVDQMEGCVDESEYWGLVRGATSSVKGNMDNIISSINNDVELQY
jgi:hypothetical protein